MGRGKSEFSTMDSISIDVDKKTAIPKNEKIDLKLDTRMRGGCTEMDPINPLNKAFDDESLEVKSKDNSLVVKYFDPIKGEVPTQQNLFQEKKKVVAGPGEVFTDTSRMKEQPSVVKPNIDTTKLSTKAKLASGSIGARVSAGIGHAKKFGENALNKWNGLSMPKKIGVGGAVGAGVLGAAHLMRRKPVQPQYPEVAEKGLLDFSKSPILNAAKKVGDKVAKIPETKLGKLGVIGAGASTMIEKPWDTKAFDLNKVKEFGKIAVPVITGGFISSDAANRLQDRRAKKSRNGMVKQIVEELKTDKE